MKDLIVQLKEKIDNNGIRNLINKNTKQLFRIEGFVVVIVVKRQNKNSKP
jgi:hypothetical protein